jgi:pimeloyl-ACP methyl ester carboxylesterase
VVIIHGGPEGQSRPGFLGRWNYFLNELGIALVYPNVRGSTGFGKTFVKLDNAMQREGTYEDIGALLDWIGEQPDLDASRILIYGGSYGGHMTLATATRYSDKIAGSVNLFGISNLRTFLENTQGYRRDLRRAEYGDERDPKCARGWTAPRRWRTWTESASRCSCNRASTIRACPSPSPTRSSPRSRTPARPSGTSSSTTKATAGARKANADYAFYTVILFAEEYLLGLRD